MKEKIKHLIQVFEIKKFIKFGLVGVLNTLVDVLVFFIVSRLIRTAAGIAPEADAPFWVTAVAQAISFVSAALNSFIWNKSWTFQKKNRITRQEATRYLVTNVGYYLVSLLLIRGVAALFQVSDAVAKLPATCCMILYNYVLNKFWVFKG